MPAPKSNAPRHELFDQYEVARGQFDDANDCAVKAVAAACGVEYERVNRLMRDLGRKKGRGTPLDIITKAVHQFGFRIFGGTGAATRLETGFGFHPHQFIKEYPKPHCNVLKSITTHHPERFPNCPMWKGRTYLALVSGGRHIVCIKDGQAIDWTHGKAKRVQKIFEILPA